jgi:hypothetical protein
MRLPQIADVVIDASALGPIAHYPEVAGQNNHARALQSAFNPRQFAAAIPKTGIPMISPSPRRL